MESAPPPNTDEPLAYHELVSQPSPRSSLWIVLGIVAGAVLLSAIVLAIGVFGFRVDYRTLPLRDEVDRAVLVQASDFQSLLDQVVIRTDAEHFEKRRYENGDTQVTYEYDHPESNSDLYISCRVCVFAGEDDVQLRIDKERRRIDMLVDSYNVDLSVQNWHPPFASQGGQQTSERRETKVGTIRQADKNCGHTLFHVEGDRVFSLFVFGVAFDFENDFASQVLPAVQALGTYSP